MARNAIEIRDLGKRYLLGERTDLTSAVGRLRGRGAVAREEFWALRDVSFDVAEGEVVGVVGSNGAGKSTLLKVLARIVEPTTGRARVRGRVGALLEVGTAFHPDLTGRENVWVNGALLGMSRRDVRRRFDEIVAFSGVEQFIDTPVKRYSSGMFLRLAFAVAAHLEPEVMVVDEVLAVGDADFQRRCLGKMSELGSHGRTVLFVSHDLGAVGQLCRSAVWLERGRIRQQGATAEVISAYRGATVAGGFAVELGEVGTADAGITRVELLDAERRPLQRVARGDALTVRLRVEVRRPLVRGEVAAWIADAAGVRIVDESLLDDPALAGSLDRPGSYDVDLELPPVLTAGDHVLGVWIGSQEHGELQDREALHIDVLPRATDTDEMVRRPRKASPRTRWRVTEAAGA